LLYIEVRVISYYVLLLYYNIALFLFYSFILELALNLSKSLDIYSYFSIIIASFTFYFYIELLKSNKIYKLTSKYLSRGI